MVSAAAMPSGASADDIIVNGSFETGDFSGWDTADLAIPFSALTVTATPNLFSATDGTRVAQHGFDGGGPGRIEISQVVSIPANATAILTFDWRAQWVNFGSLARTLDVIVEPAGGGAPLLTANILTAAPGTSNPDTGASTANVDLSALTGQSVRVRLSAFIPEDFTGPANMIIDNVVLDVQVTDTPVVDDGPSDAEIATRTRRGIKNFVSRRADQITANDVRLVERLTGDGGGVPGGYVNFTGQGGSGSGGTNHVAFSTSLKQILAAGQASKDRRRSELSQAIGLDTIAGDGARATPVQRFDIWTRGKWVEVDSDTAESSIGLFYLGADYRFSESFLLGVATQFDRTDENDDVQGIAGDGHGWMAGPYMVMRLDDNLLLDASARWGTADNTITLEDTFASTGDYESSRWLVSGTLTGDYAVGSLAVAPSVGVLYFEEEQDAFTNSLGILIPGQTVSLGRLTFGPKISTSMAMSDGAVATPFVAVKGLWDFEHAEIVNLTTGIATGTDDLRARIEGGVGLELASGMSLTGEGFYDGIGADDFEAYGGSVKLVVPLN